MYKLYNYALLIALLIGCSTSPKKIANKETLSVPKPIKLEGSIDTKLKTKMKECQFRVVIKNGKAVIQQLDSTKIVLPDKFVKNLEAAMSNCKSCFSFDMNLDTLINVNMNKEGRFVFGELMDINFDGFLDIVMPKEAYCCSGSNLVNEIWVYNKEEDNFKYHSKLSQMSIWKRNTEKKTIITGWHMSAYHYGTSSYTFQNGKMKLIEESETNFYNDTLVKMIRKKLVNNYWKIDTLVHSK